MPKFTDFIVQLSTNTETLVNWGKDPQETMREAGLSAAEQTILLQGDPELISNTIAAELGVASSLIKPFYTITIKLTTVHVNVTVKE